MYTCAFGESVAGTMAENDVSAESFGRLRLWGEEDNKFASLALTVRINTGIFVELHRFKRNLNNLNTHVHEQCST